MDLPFEHLLRVDHWHDGVREGIALFRGAPHAFRSLAFESGGDIDDDRFHLTPVDSPEIRPIIARAQFRRSSTAPDPACPPLRPQEVRWLPV